MFGQRCGIEGGRDSRRKGCCMSEEKTSARVTLGISILKIDSMGDSPFDIGSSQKNC